MKDYNPYRPFQEQKRDLTFEEESALWSDMVFFGQYYGVLVFDYWEDCCFMAYHPDNARNWDTYWSDIIYHRVRLRLQDYLGV